jgi:site-specific recombinase XerD
MTRKIPKVLSTQEQDRLLAPLRDSDRPIKLRNLALLRLMLDAGLRVSEAAGLRQDDLDLDTGYLLVHGKGRKQRGVWVNGETLRLLKKYLATLNGRFSNGWLFCTRGGHRISRHYVYALLKRLGKQAGLKVYPHLLRHSFATDLLRQTKNLRLVQKALGHANITTTTIYAHICDDELEKAMKGLRG